MLNNKYYKQQIALHFNLAANQYDQYAKLPKITAAKLLNKITKKVIQPRMVLDIGSGTGYCAKILSEFFPTSNFINVDLADKMLLANNYKNNNIFSVNADSDQLPFADDSIDLIYSNMCLQWSPILIDTLRELNRVLRENNLLAFSILGKGTLKELQASWQEVDTEQHVNHFYSDDEIMHCLQTNNFIVNEIENSSLQFSYDNIFSLFHALKGIGGNYVPKRINHGLKKVNFLHLAKAYEKFRNNEDQLIATYEVKYFLVTKRRK